MRIWRKTLYEIVETDIGRFISMFSAVFGVAVIALPSGVITVSYLDELREEKKNPK